MFNFINLLSGTHCFAKMKRFCAVLLLLVAIGMANSLVSSQVRCEVCNLEFSDQYFAFKTEFIL